MARHLELGKKGERLAYKFLTGLGYDILARNYRAAQGEIDLIAYDGQTLVFVEVKTRSTVKFGLPIEAVDAAKQRQIKRAAAEFRRKFEMMDRTYRFDVVTVMVAKQPEIRLFKNAF